MKINVEYNLGKVIALFPLEAAPTEEKRFEIQETEMVLKEVTVIEQKDGLAAVEAAKNGNLALTLDDKVITFSSEEISLIEQCASSILSQLSPEAITLLITSLANTLVFEEEET